jgi:exonuclease SbcC
MNITIEGLKGVSDQFELSPLTLLNGPNGSGKSARLEALRWAAYGTTPNGKTLEAAAALADQGEMSVRIDLADFGWERSISRDPTSGAIRQKITVEGREKLKQKEAEALIAERCGDLSAALDLNEFTSLSPDLRRQFVMNLCGAGSSDGLLMLRLDFAIAREVIGEEAIAAVSRTLHQKGPDELAPPEMAHVFQAVWPTTVDEHTRKAWDTVRGKLADDEHDDDLETITAWVDRAKDLKSAHRKGRDTAHAATQRLAADKNALVVDPVHIEALKQRAAKVQAQIDEINGKAGAAQGEKARREVVLQALQEAKAREARAGEALTRAEQVVQRCAGDKELDQLQGLAGSADEVAINQGYKVAEAAEEDVRSAGARVIQNQNDRDRLLGELNATNRELERERESLTNAQSDAWVKAERLAGYAAGLLQGTAPEELRDAVISLWGLAKEQSQGSRKIAEEVSWRIAELEPTATEQEATLNAKRVAQNVLDREHDKATAALAKAREDAEAIRVRFADAQAAKVKLAELQAKRKAAGAEAQRCAESLAIATQERAEAQAKADALPSEVDDLDTLMFSKSERIARLDAVRAQIAAKDKLEALETELASCIERAARESVSYDLAHHAQAAVKSLRERLLHLQVEPLLTAVDEFLAAAQIKARSYCSLRTERGKAEFDLGWVIEDGHGLEHKRSMATLSGGEAALFAAGLAYALVRLADPPLKMLTIEADTLDAENMRRLLAGLGLVGAALDHVIVATCHPTSAPGIWKVDTCCTPEVAV